ncbi:hypothetical protein CEP51_000029 [Fusarium floridanum]|uniref:Uncharacterized protein n=1 Tax=Fusarium floridanum TaxID=1325733 RepID=A0A428SPT2_9HYPO|nr:hypothetical protein CEP51_000029 [Fusarium floridanum]
MADDNAVYLLASWAKEFSRVLLDICRSEKRRLPSNTLCLAGEVATRLHIVCPYIESLPEYWIESDLDQLCRDLLRHLAMIYMWPEKMQISLGLAYSHCLKVLAENSALKSSSGLEKSICEYFSHPANMEDIETFRKDCNQLYKSLAPTGAEEAQDPLPNLRDVAQYDHSKHNQALFDVLQKHCQCHPDLHEALADNVPWHPTRLGLEGDSKGASFCIMVSSLDMSCWQEFRLSVPPNDSTVTTGAAILDEGQICSLVDQPLFARILFEFSPEYDLYQLPRSEVQELILAAGQGESLANILRNYGLTPGNKVLLSYSIARAYWQFYDSELMRKKWSSDTIWFMPTAEHIDKLPLKAFVSFPFDSPDGHIDDYIHDLRMPLNHRCPRVFALGILLLEIGLAKPFPTRVFNNLNSQVNFDHKTAINLLKTLRETKWNGFSNMRYFVDAVEYCLEGGNFVQDEDDLGPAGREPQPCEKKSDMSLRRKNLYDNVVRPLAWLAVKGFNSNAVGTTYISRIANSTVTTAQRPPPTIEAPIKLKDGAFHSGITTPSNWMQNLKRISAHVDSIRSQLELTEPIRVAILDTGINYDMPYYEDDDYGDNRIDQVECFRDFLEPEVPSQKDKSQPEFLSKKDDFGHGSLMARLVADTTPFESTPFVKIMVARVARNTEDLTECQDKIAEAIRWAGSQGADIISMSFGFPRKHQGISEAIYEVASREGGAIFLASAGNSSDEAEAFPARHSKVISIYATNRHGTFLESNSQRPNNGTHILGTYGDGIPPEIMAEFDREYRGVCQPGSSVATAVAAGIAAIMLAYIAALPKLFPSYNGSETLHRAHDSRGMEALFRKMGPQLPDGRFFINPVDFWRVNNTDEARFHAISSWLWNIDRYM